MSKSVDDRIEAGIEVLKATRNGENGDFIWKMLADMGFSPEERVKVAETVKGFLNHKKGIHDDCPSGCGMTESLAEETTKMDKFPSNDKLREMIASKREHEHSYSKDTLEEWR